MAWLFLFLLDWEKFNPFRLDFWNNFIFDEKLAFIMECKLFKRNSLIIGTVCLIGCVNNQKDNTPKVSQKEQKPNVMPSNNKQTYYYDSPTVELTGKVALMDVVYPDEDEFSGKKSHIPVLVLANKISVINRSNVDTLESDQPNEYNVDTIQLVASESVSYELLRKLVNHKTKIKGSLFHSFNGNHFTNVLIDVAHVQMIQ